MSNTIANHLAQSSTVEKLVKELVAEVEAHSARIEGVRPAKPENAEISKALIARIGAARGRPLFFQYVGSGIGRGVYVELEDGSVKLDLINGIGIHLMGHSHPRVIAASLRGSLSDIVMQGNLQPNKEYLAFSE